ncbi:hypothetical protein POVWA2_056270 [Plasmodium ovale wallikeri]|uniref:Uncharacterized protein n=1 Tax=Plasmodium ovale wallikeri TaxID=864142 RepID=A0A1A8ZV92_PLAOA|nr:hypothetical protein POVWA1_056880 [Plasmodium ovale wallikeri]SBT48501.1 hypothetical protein POVWA2_056270 [Plasmodium ovale wallikeri]
MIIFRISSFSRSENCQVQRSDCVHLRKQFCDNILPQSPSQFLTFGMRFSTFLRNLMTAPQNFSKLLFLFSHECGGRAGKRLLKKKPLLCEHLKGVNTLPKSMDQESLKYHQSYYCTVKVQVLYHFFIVNFLRIAVERKSNFLKRYLHVRIYECTTFHA